MFTEGDITNDFQEYNWTRVAFTLSIWFARSSGYFHSVPGRAKSDRSGQKKGPDHKLNICENSAEFC